jgi:hypothetical protein
MLIVESVCLSHEAVECRGMLFNMCAHSSSYSSSSSQRLSVSQRHMGSASSKGKGLVVPEVLPG